MEQENSGHDTAFIGIAKIGIMMVSAGGFLHRRNDTITLHTIYSPCLGPEELTVCLGPEFLMVASNFSHQLISTAGRPCFVTAW
jgi:hypothetical protein